MPCLGCPRGLRVISYRWRIGLGRIVFFPCGSGTGLRGRAASFRGKVYSSRERFATFPGRKVSNCRFWLGGRPWLFVWLFTELLVILLLLLAWLLRKLLPSGGRWTVAGGELSPSPGGRRAVAGVGLRELGGDWTCLFRVMLLLTKVIFPSFLDTKWFSLFICLCFTLLNLSSLTLLMKPWHCSSLSCEMIEASLVQQFCISLSTWSKILLIALILACSKSFSAFLIICLAFGVSKVDFNLILTGINSLCIHLREKILWFQIIGREGHNLARNIKESIYIRVNNPSLNNNIGKFNLSHIWDRVLLNTKGLTLK